MAAPGADVGAAPSGDGIGENPSTTPNNTANPTAQFVAFEPAPGMLRRLTRTQFRNSVRNVFGVEVDISDLDGDSWEGDFAAVGASTVVTSAVGAEQYQSAIEDAVDAALSDATRTSFIGCTPALGPGDACTRSFIETKGRLAWRRPLDAAEIDRFAALAENAATELESAIEGIRWVAVALFASPNFLYRAELGTPTADGSLRLTGYEMASRLAFLFWNAAPDEALLDEAANGALDTPAGVRAAAERLMDAPAGREAVGAFAEEYMRLDRIDIQAKDQALFPEYGPSLQTAMARDMRDVWTNVALDEQASVLDVFTTDKAVVNADLAKLYELDTSGLDSNTFEERTMPPDSPRMGILSKAGFLSQFANQKEGSPTLRGKFMRQSLMCQTVPPPPENAVAILPESPEGTTLTKRERLELHRADPACAGCHALMDPLGLPLESYDAIGRYRTTELGLPVDPSGEFDGQQVADSRELGSVVGSSEMVADCLVQKYYSYAQGYAVRTEDLGTIDELATSFEASGYKFRELALNVATHETFSLVAPQPQ
jgi:hypothetical protein